MHEVRTRKTGRSAPAAARRGTSTAKTSGAKSARKKNAKSGKPKQDPAKPGRSKAARSGSASPARFPAEVQVPAHRGAVIVAGPVEDRPVRARRTRAAASAKATPPGAPAGPRKRSPARAIEAARAAPQPAVPPSPPAIPLPALPEALVVPAPAAVPPAATTAPGELPPSRALVKPGSGLIGRVVAWLERLIPRRSRAAMPRVRTRLDRPAAAPIVPPSPAPSPGPVAPETAGDLTRRMLLQLSEENERLRRENQTLRASVREPGRV